MEVPIPLCSILPSPSFSWSSLNSLQLISYIPDSHVPAQAEAVPCAETPPSLLKIYTFVSKSHIYLLTTMPSWNFMSGKTPHCSKSPRSCKAARQPPLLPTFLGIPQNTRSPSLPFSYPVNVRSQACC